MPVRRFRSVDEMPRADWYSADDPRLWRRIAALWELGARLCPRRRPPGVHRNRTIDEANARRLSWELGPRPPGTAS